MRGDRAPGVADAECVDGRRGWIEEVAEADAVEADRATGFRRSEGEIRYGGLGGERRIDPDRDCVVAGEVLDLDDEEMRGGIGLGEEFVGDVAHADAEAGFVADLEHAVTFIRIAVPELDAPEMGVVGGIGDEADISRGAIGAAGGGERAVDAGVRRGYGVVAGAVERQAGGIGVAERAGGDGGVAILPGGGEAAAARLSGQGRGGAVVEGFLGGEVRAVGLIPDVREVAEVGVVDHQAADQSTSLVVRRQHGIGEQDAAGRVLRDDIADGDAEGGVREKPGFVGGADADLVGITTFVVEGRGGGED